MDTMTIVIGLLLAGLAVMAIMKYMSNMEGFQGLTNMFSRQSSSARQISSVGQSSSARQISSVGQSSSAGQSPSPRPNKFTKEMVTRVKNETASQMKRYGCNNRAIKRAADTFADSLLNKDITPALQNEFLKRRTMLLRLAMKDPKCTAMVNSMK